MKRNRRYRDRLPGFLLLGGLGIAGAVIIITYTALPLPQDVNPVSSSEKQALEEEALDLEEGIPATETAPAIERVEEVPSALPTTLVHEPGSREPGGCVSVTYRHKALAGHPNRERCSGHRNLIALGRSSQKGEVSKINWSSVCLRVDGVVTAFERVPQGILFGPFAGPESRVSLRYCHGKANCPENCDPPRDLFLEAIGATLKKDKGAPVAVAKWDPSEAEEDANPTAALELELQDLAVTDHQAGVFKDWSVVATANGCGGSRSVAANSP